MPGSALQDRACHGKPWLIGRRFNRGHDCCKYGRAKSGGQSFDNRRRRDGYGSHIDDEIMVTDGTRDQVQQLLAQPHAKQQPEYRPDNAEHDAFNKDQ